MQKKQIKRPYLAPELTVVDFKVERGLDASGTQIDEGYWSATTDPTDATLLLLQMQMDEAQEAYNQNAYFGDPVTGNWGSDFWNH